MIQNKVVANVIKKVSNEDEAELKAMLGEYERKLSEMEKDSEKNNLKLKQVIESLLKEKDELSQRLINANNKKLSNLLDFNQQPRTSTIFVNEVKKVDSFYLWNCGIINSYKGIDPLIQKNQQKNLDP